MIEYQCELVDKLADYKDSQAETRKEDSKALKESAILYRQFSMFLRLGDYNGAKKIYDVMDVVSKHQIPTALREMMK